LSHSERDARVSGFSVSVRTICQYQRLAERLELMVGRLVRRCDFGDQGAEVQIEPTVEGALGGVAINRRQHDPGDDENHHHPCGRRQKKSCGERASAHSGHDPEKWRPVFG
jgi:hypothetical protein